MRILVIQHVACEGPGLLGDELIANGWELDIRCMDIPSTVLPDDLDEYQALIILGGPMGVYEEDRFPYFFKVQGLIRESVAGSIPCVGICLGGQLIARALGAAVYKNPVKEIGWTPIRLLPAGKSTPLFRLMPNGFSVFQWHTDTFALPEGAVLLASSEDCRNQAFVYGNHVWALQFHLEVTPEMIADWSEIYQNELIAFAGPGGKDRLLNNTRARWEAMRSGREQFLSNICAILRS
ncbi:Glutamine amidotransferase [Syntrophomonas zehnderi OL-4]|uniref:Glutamine amidotransferase n=1 Tax=Syntrophomonas zehnderi OL-4 TaxID=690567 RepID=A0A0E3W3B6_9FIRM|nr:type 1 glutamine amidotransferase [Syntrophomonas zehnderi]CFX69893.1 Glutamine amidotransferase [Syntrophomonas zehnderi OL-4]